MISFTLDSVKKMGPPDEKYGTAYWCGTAGSDLPIKFNSMDDTLEDKLRDGPLQIVAEEKEERESKKGIAYIQLRKVKLVESEPAQTSITKEKVNEVFPPEVLSGELPSPLEIIEPMQSQLDRIETKIDEILTYLLPENQ